MKRFGLIFAVMIMASVAACPGASAAGDSALAPYLLRPGDMSGFQVGSPSFFRTIEGISEPSGASLSPIVARRYEAEGFVEAAIVRIRSRQRRGTTGASSVVELESPGAAQEELKAKFQEELKAESQPPGHASKLLDLKRFRVSGVPGAVGFALLPKPGLDWLGGEVGSAS